MHAGEFGYPRRLAAGTLTQDLREDAPPVPQRDEVGLAADARTLETRDLDDLQVGDGSSANVKRAGFLPYLTLIAGVAVLLLANWFFKL